MNAKNKIFSAKIVNTIEIKLARGTGTEDNPVRRVTQYWSTNGQLLAEYDPEKDNFMVLSTEQD